MYRPPRRVLLLAVLTVCLLVAPVFGPAALPVLALFMRDGPEFRVNTTTLDYQSRPKVAMAADGRFVVVWHSSGQDGSGVGVYAQRYATDGTPRGGEFRVNSTTDDDQYSPAVAMAPDGRFVVTWTGRSDDLVPRYGVVGQRYAADGTPLGGEFLANVDPRGGPHFPAVAMGADGQFVVIWRGGDSYLFGVVGRRFAADGTPVGGEFRVNGATTDTVQDRSAVAMAEDGWFVVAWTTLDQDGSYEGVYARRYAADGTPHGDEFQVNTYTLSNQYEPSVAIAANSRFVIAWTSLVEDNSGAGVYAQRYLTDEPPVVRLSAGALAYVEGSGPQIVDGAATVTDVDSRTFGDGALTIELLGKLPEDRLGILNQGAGPGQIGVLGSTVFYGGEPIGTIGSPGFPFIVWLNGDATHAAAQALLRAVTYENVSQNPATTVRTVLMTLSDGDGETSVPATRTITVSAVNQPPIADGDAFTVRGPVLVVPAPGVLANDVDPDSPSLTVQVVTGPTEGALTLQPDGGFTYVPGVGYRGTDRFTYRASDGIAQSGEATVTLSGAVSACAPRPRVTTTPVAGGGRLQVTVAATPLNGPSNNFLQEIRFGDPALGVADPQNARIIFGGQAHTDRFTYTVPPGTSEVTFTIERITPGRPTTVFLAVMDGCGTWKTLVGGGTGAGF